MASAASRAVVKALLDEMVPHAIAEQLRTRGHDVIAVTERHELRSLDDPDLFDFAQLDGRIMVTRNRDDFLALDTDYRANNRTHHGLVLLNRFPEDAIGPIVKALDHFLAGEPSYPTFVHWLGSEGS